MAYTVVALMRDWEAGRNLLDTLDHAGFGGEYLAASENVVGYLAERGVPQNDARAYVRVASQGRALLCVHADEEAEAEEAAEIAEARGGATRIYDRSAPASGRGA